MLSVRSGPTTGLHVYLKIDDKSSIEPSMAALVDPKWLNLSGTFKEIDMEQIDGRNLATKLELILAMVSQHHILLSQNLARLMGWQILSYNGCSGVGEMEDFATASSIQFVAPNNDRMLSVRSGPTTGLHVYLKLDDKSCIEPSMAALVDPKWLNLSGTFKEIDMEQIDGRNLATRLLGAVGLVLGRLRFWYVAFPV